MPVEVSKEEFTHYAEVSKAVYEQKPDSKKHLNNHAKALLASTKHAFPEASEEMLYKFIGSVSFLVAQILSTPVSEVGQVLDVAFDSYILAAASLIGAVDLDAAGGPSESEIKDDLIKKMHEMRNTFVRNQETEDILNRQYL